MPIEFSKEFFDTAGWGDINKAVVDNIDLQINAGGYIL